MSSIATPARNVQNWTHLHKSNAYFADHPRYRDRLHTLGLERLTALLNPRPDDTLLEIGCGYGRLLYHLLPHVRAVVGVELADEPLAEARELLASVNHPNGMASVRLIRNDGLTLAAVPDESITGVYAFTVIQHMTRAGARGYLREARRVLAPGGRLCVQFFAAQGPAASPDADILDIPREQSIAYTPAQVCEMIEQAGLRLERLERECLEAAYPGRGLAWLWALATRPADA